MDLNCCPYYLMDAIYDKDIIAHTLFGRSLEILYFMNVPQTTLVGTYLS